MEHFKQKILLRLVIITLIITNILPGILNNQEYAENNINNSIKRSVVDNYPFQIYKYLIREDIDKNLCKTSFQIVKNIYFTYVNHCSKGEYCENTDNPKIDFSFCNEITNNTPGEECKNDNSCLSKICELFICKGKSEESVCQKHEDCEVGLYCKIDKNITGICKKQIKRFTYNNESIKRNQLELMEELDSNDNINKTTYDNQQCESDYECANNLVCNLNKCVEIFSLSEHNYANNYLACKSGFVIDNYCVNITKLVNPFPNNINDESYNFRDKKYFSIENIENFVCFFDSDCVYEYIDKNNNKLQINLQCIGSQSYLFDTFRLCERDTSNFTKYAKIFIKSIDMNVNTVKRYNLNKLSTDEIRYIKFPKFESYDSNIISSVENTSSNSFIIYSKIAILVCIIFLIN